MSEMMERVRKTIREEYKSYLCDFDSRFGTICPPKGCRCQDVARAAIAAMRTPTEEMIEASNREWDGRMSHRSSGAWQAMIDAAHGTKDEVTG